MPHGNAPEATAQRKKTFLRCLEDHLCNVSATCKTLGIARETAYNWKQTDPEFKAAFEEIQDFRLDYVESKLLQNIDSGNVAAQIFFLKCQGKKRGYIERTELTGADGGPVSNQPDPSTLLAHMSASQLADLKAEMEREG